jgi:ubiquinone/menaquinone biosynthesis C-methylase UbiE
MRPTVRQPAVSKERAFEKRDIALRRDRYLATDVVAKVASDAGYRAKVELIRRFLGEANGWVLDIGANTCGESEYLTAQGYSIIATDVNEYALGISKERAALYGRQPPEYVAADAHRLPLADDSVEVVVMYEALHHMPVPARVVAEASRVLIPGGRLFLCEPYAYNPYRRLAEVKDRVLRPDTIEMSFGVGELRSMVEAQRFTRISFERPVLPPSRWKMETQTFLHGVLKELYHRVSAAMPRLFGSVVLSARKPDEAGRSDGRLPLDSILRCPATGHVVARCKRGVVCSDADCRRLFPEYLGIPVLVLEDAVVLDADDWTSEIGQPIADDADPHPARA